jgi:drug/metabolite transporter (DMT)-like permease
MSAAVARPGAQAALGITFLVMAVACFAVLDTAVKYVGAFVPILVAVWFRYVFQAVAVSTVMLPLRGRSLLHTRHPRFQMLRGCLLLMVSVLSFISVQYMPVGEFTAFVMTTPLVVTLLAALFLKERVAPMRWVLVGGGFVGALLVVQPGGDVIGWASLLPLLMVVTYAWFQILTSQMARTEDPMTMHFYTAGWVRWWPARSCPWSGKPSPTPTLSPCSAWWASWARSATSCSSSRSRARPRPRSRPTCTPRSALPCCAAGWCSTTSPADWN